MSYDFVTPDGFRRVPFQHPPNISKTSRAHETWQNIRSVAAWDMGVLVLRMPYFYIELPMSMLLQKQLQDLYLPATEYGALRFLRGRLWVMLRFILGHDCFEIFCCANDSYPFCLDTFNGDVFNNFLAQPPTGTFNGVHTWILNLSVTRSGPIGGQILRDVTEAAAPSVTFFDSSGPLGRKGQKALARALRQIYGGACVVTGEYSPTPEAAHLVPVRLGNIYIELLELSDNPYNPQDTAIEQAKRYAFQSPAALPLCPVLHKMLDNLDHTFIPIMTHPSGVLKVAAFHWSRARTDVDRHHLKVLRFDQQGPLLRYLEWLSNQAFIARTCRSF